MNIKSPFIILSLFLLFGIQNTFGQIKTYPALKGNKYQSQTYAVKVRSADASGTGIGSYENSFTFEYLRSYRDAPSVNISKLSDNHWTTFEFNLSGNATQAQIEVSKTSGSISSVEFRPTTAINSHNISNGKLTVNMDANQRVTVFINGDIKQPLFLFCDPKETDIPSKTGNNVFLVKDGTTSKNAPLKLSDIPSGTTTVYFEEGGIHYIFDANSNRGLHLTNDDNGNRLNSNKIEQIYIPGGALVVGAIRASRATNLMVNGRGILAGEESYDYADAGDYFKDRIMNSAIYMGDYGGSTNRNQVVKDVTCIMPLKYTIQVGAYAKVHNCKAFAFHQTTDGVGAEDNAQIYDNFFKVNDDVIKIYNDNMDVHDNMIWHQDNGAAFQFGWGSESGKGSVIKNTTIIRDDSYDAKGTGWWSNHSIINWHKANNKTHQNITFDGINNEGMPAVDMWVFLGINMDSERGDGGTGGVMKNLTIKNVKIGKEKWFSHIGATNGSSSVEVNFQNVKRNGVCMNASNVSKTANVTITPATGCGTIIIDPTDPVDPVISFSDPVQNGTISGTYSIKVNAYDEDYGTNNGDGITSVYFQLFDANDATQALFAETVTTSPFSWNLNTENYPDGEYELRAGVQSEDFTDNRKWTTLKPITISNGGSSMYPYTWEANGNPIITHIRTADPSAHVWVDGKLWVYASHDMDDATDYSTMDGYHVFSTEDMNTWTDHGEILHSKDVPWAEGGYMWAPDCAYKNGKYYLYFPTHNKNGNFRTGVAVSDFPQGPFKAEDNYIDGTTGIDPACFVDDNGDAYLYFGYPGNAKVAKLSDDMLSLAESPKTIDYGADNYHEGPFMHKRDGIYYFSYTDWEDPNNQGYYAMGTSPYGPFTYQGALCGNPEGAQDHHSIVEFKDQWYYFYHVGNYNGGSSHRRNVCAEPLYYNADGTIQMVTYTKDGIDPDGKNEYQTIPALIQAESYTAEDDIDTETTQDAGGGSNVGWIDTGDWIEYKLDAKTGGEYTLDFRIAAETAHIKFDIKEGNTTLASVNESATGGWQVWETRSTKVQLEAGKHIIRIVAQGGGWNLNWFDWKIDNQIPPVGDDGILSDGSFENSVNIDELGSWTLQGEFVSQSTDVVKSGNSSAKFQKEDGNYIEPEYDLTDLFTCYGSGTYTVELSVYVPSSNNGTVELYFINGENSGNYFQPKDVRDEWVTLSNTITYTTGDEIKLKAKTYGGPTGATFYVDDISINTTNSNSCNSQEETPEDLSDVKAVAENCTTVVLTWTDTQGEDGYRIRRKVSGEVTYSNLGDVTADVETYTDETAEEGVTYIYMVRPLVGSTAVKVSNTPEVSVPNCTPTEITQTIELKQGWNLISLFIEPEPCRDARPCVSTVFPNAEIVKTFDSFYKADQEPFMNSLQTIEAGTGYLVYNSIDETIKITGVETHGRASLQDGWNLIGITEDIAIKDLPFEFFIVKDFEGFYEAGNEINSLTTLEKGKAYFIYK